MSLSLKMVKRIIKHPNQELLRYFFRFVHKQRPPHEIVCRVRDFQLKVMSDSVLAESLYCGGGFEDGEGLLMAQLVQPGMRMIDIGANIGLYSVMFAKKTGCSGKVWSFEPYSPVARMLRENLALNDLRNVEVIEKAAAESVGVNKFYVFPAGADVYNSLGARERVENISAEQEIEVQVTTLDTFALEAGIDSVDIIKVDAEGAEERVLKGAEQLILNSPNITILSELYEPSARQCGCSVKRLVHMLQGWGFEMYAIDEQGNSSLVSLSEFTGTYALFKRGTR